MIKISNYRNFETVSYSLPLITGEIVGISDAEIQVKCKKNSAEVTSWPVIKGKFKILVSLIPGRNEIEIKFNSVVKEFNLIYKPLAMKRFIRLVYITCCDSDTFQSPPGEDNSVKSACDRISLAARMLQSFTAAKLKSHGLTPKTFRLEESDGKLQCHVYRSSLHMEDALKMSGQELWEYFAVELMNSSLRVGNDCKFLGILSFTRYCNESGVLPGTYKEIKSLTKGFVALATGGLALLGSACLHTWPQTLQEVPWRFADDRQIDRQALMDDSGFRGTHWGCYATTLGAVVHELGHIFDLGHTPVGIMSRGFEHIHRHFIVDLFYSRHIFQKKHNPYYQKSVHEKENSVHIEKSSSLSWKVKREIPLSQKNSYSINNVEAREAGQLSSQELYVLPSKPPWKAPDPSENDNAENGAFWSRSSALILSYHKWFNDFHDENEKNIDADGTIFSSPFGIRVVELRDEEHTTFQHFEYLEGSPPTTINLQSLQPHLPANGESFNVLVEDSFGNNVEKLISYELVKM